MLSHIIGTTILAVAFILFGNYLGDQKTLVNCATTGQAKMAGGGTINCTVKNKQ